MIFGLSLKYFAKLEAQGENARASIFVLRLLKKQQINKFKTRQLDDLTFFDYIDLKRYFETADYHNFCRTFVVKKWWQVIYMHHTSAIFEEFGRQKEELKQKYYYVFDPPQYGEPGKESIGADLRLDFVKEFGDDVVIMDVLTQWSKLSYKEIEQWKTGEVLYWANYLYGQKIVENVK